MKQSRIALKLTRLALKFAIKINKYISKKGVATVGIPVEEYATLLKCIDEVRENVILTVIQSNACATDPAAERKAIAEKTIAKYISDRDAMGRKE